MINLSELARVITGAIVNEYVSRGYVETGETAPEVGAQVAPNASATVRETRRTPNARSAGQTAPVAVPLPQVSAAQTSPAAAWVNPRQHAQDTAAQKARNASELTAHAPEGIAAKIGGERDPRIKLPKALFANFSTVVLVFPNGAQAAVSEDSEGRAKFNRKLAIEYTGASEGQYLVFEEGNAGFFHVHVRNAVLRPSKAHATSEQKHAKIENAGRALMYAGAVAPKAAAVAVPPSTFAAMFGPLTVPAAQAQAVSTAQTPTKAKRPGARCPVCNGPGVIDKNVFAVDGRPGTFAHRKCYAQAVAEGKGNVRPLYDAGNKKGRPEPAHNIGAAQKAYAAVPVAQAPAAQQVPAAVAVPLPGIVDVSGRADRMRQNLALAARAVPVSK